jgi:hypothetical protein
MLTILNDPAGITGWRRYELDPSHSLQANIALHMPGGADCELRINGVTVDPLTDPRMDAPPSLLDSVVVVRRPEGLDPVTWLIIAAVVATATYVLMPSMPNLGGATSKDSPNNRLTGQSNIARAYQAIPDVYGYRRVWPDLIQPSVVEYVDHVKYITEWMCVSRGKGTITSVQYAETPIDDIDGASYEVFEPVPSGGYPEFGSTTLLNVAETFASDEVNGQELMPVEPFATLTKAGTFTAALSATTFTVKIPDGSDLDQIKSLIPSGTAAVSFSHVGGSFSQTCKVQSVAVASGNATFTFSCSAWPAAHTNEASTFNIVPNGAVSTVIGPFTLPVECSRIWWNTIFQRGLKGSVQIRAEWWKVDSGGVEIGGTRQTQDNTYTASTYDQRFYTNKVTPSAGSGRYRIQFKRLNGINGDGSADVAKLEEVYAVREYASKTLPGVTAIRVTTKATESATGFSDRKFNLRWLRHVRTLTSNTLSESRNFARSMAHIWTIAGNDITGLDTDALQAINADLGETSALLRFDGSLDDADMSLGERLQYVANTARCVVWRDGTKWTATRDQARPYPELQLDYRNLAAGGDSTISYAAHLPATNDGIELEYVDELTQSKKSYIRLNISSGSPVAGAVSNPRKVKLQGCTTQAQAENRAQLEARRLIYQRVSVSDTALADAGGLGIGALVRWIDPNDFAGDDGLQAGEVLAISGNVITTSEAVDWKGQTSGRIMFTGQDGKQVGTTQVCYPVSGGVQVAALPSGVYVADDDRQLGSRYAFSPGLTQAETEAAGLYTVTEVRPAADGTVSLALAQYDQRIYGAD